MASDERESFLMAHLPEAAYYYDLLTDFRNSGFRVLGDLVCDVDDENSSRERKKLIRQGDLPYFTAVMEASAAGPD